MWPQDQLAEQRDSQRGSARNEIADATPLAAIFMPAMERSVGFARLATAHLCQVVGLSAGRVADLRLAVNEACGQFLGSAAPLGDPAGALRLRFDLEPETLRITVGGPITRDWPDRESLGWTLLVALVADLRHAAAGGFGTLVLAEPLSSDHACDDELWFAAP
jgi:hypothetical protein